jgi:hypothetical protein
MKNATIGARAGQLAFTASLCLVAACGSVGGPPDPYGDDLTGRGTGGAGGAAADDSNESADGLPLPSAGAGKPAPPPAAAPDPVDPLPNAANAAKPVWVFNAYCGGALGACEANTADCLDAGAVTGNDCTNVFDRCLGPANANGIRKKYVCIPRGEEVWAFNGYCSGDPNVACTPSAAKPACAAGTGAGSACAGAGTKCVKGSKTFVCLPKAGSAWVANAHCGDAFVGEKACSLVPHPLCTEIGPGGNACDANVPRCVTSKDASAPGKVFACVGR